MQLNCYWWSMKPEMIWNIVISFSVVSSLRRNTIKPWEVKTSKVVSLDAHRKAFKNDFYKYESNYLSEMWHHTVTMYLPQCPLLWEHHSIFPYLWASFVFSFNKWCWVILQGTYVFPQYILILLQTAGILSLMPNRIQHTQLHLLPCVLIINSA